MRNKFKIFFSIVSILLSLNAGAQVAYIPILEARAGTEFTDQILVVDLDNGQVLKKIRVGAGVGPVFINDHGDLLYAAATDENKIVQIDTTQLTISQTWPNLPIQPEQIVLNPTEEVLYFAASNQDDIYQLDITSGTVTLAIQIPGFQSMHYSDNLAYLVFYAYDSSSEDYQLHTYTATALDLISQTIATSTEPSVINNDGESYYSSIFSYGMQARSLVDNSLIWEFRHGSGQQGPFGELSETFTAAFLFNENTLLLNGRRGGTYLVDINDGTGSRISTLNNPFNQNTPINGYRFLQSNRPQQVVCPPIAPCPDAGRYLPLVLTLQNYDSNSENLIFSQVESGNVARGRYIGELFYNVPAVPLFSHWLNVVLTLFVFLVLAYGGFSRLRK